MYKLIKNELLKEIKKKKTIIMLFMLVIIMLFSNIYMLNSRRTSSPQNRIKQNQKFIDDLKINLERSNNKNNKNDIQNKIKDMESLNNELQFEIDNKDLGWRDLAERKIADIDNKLNKLEDGSIEDKDNLEIGKKMYQICLDKNIEPVYTGDKEKALNVIISIIRLMSMFFIPIFVVVIISDSISGEFNPMTIRMMLVRPVSKVKIYLSKFITLNILTVGSVLLLELINFLTLGIMIGFENPELPNIVGGKYQNDLLNGVSLVHGSMYLLPIWKVLMIGIGLQALYMICACAFIMMISTISKNSILSVSINFVVCVGTSLFVNVVSRSNFEAIKTLYNMIFAGYFDGVSVITGELSRTMKNPNISIYSSFLIIGIQLVIFYLLGTLIFNRKEKTI
ncbi:ABC transporter permease subunit [Clostridium sp. YIM B02505]|uniref:ABC transporter permease subunit n=1 Tax=Clostridium yunnanense TaxID=2800325 RepID=A0ABS1ELF4_9CLOT|nr:ABC transporter permease subunit [Clostridium yunnanense]MBK1810185.1 ABC transporter permease subunit [Clostridium yunnanense]